MHKKFLLPLIISLFLLTPSVVFAEQTSTQGGSTSGGETTQETQKTKPSSVLFKEQTDKQLGIKPSQESSTGAAAAFSGGGSTMMSTTAGGPLGGANTATVQVDPHTGSASTSIPIAVPQGRGGIQPNLAIAYNSALKGGLLGTGWTIELGSIQISTKRGVPKYDTSDKYVLLQTGSSQELVYDSTAAFYRTETEGAFMKTEKLLNGWTVTDKKGIKYHFGTALNSQEYDPANSSRIFKWCLDKVEDVHGNYMSITYVRHDNKLYPDKIQYTGNSAQSLPTFASVEFELEARPDHQMSYISKFKTEVKKRIKNVRVKVGTDLQRRYNFTYATSTATQRSIMTAVTQYGADDVSTLPVTTFEYQNNKGFVLSTGWTIPNDIQFSATAWSRLVDRGVRVADVNADGYADIVRSNHYDGSPIKDTWINTKSNGWTLSSNWDRPDWHLIETNSTADKDIGNRFADIDGDGWVDDNLYYEETNGSIYVRSHINNKTTGWNQDVNWNLPQPPSFPNKVPTVVSTGSNGSLNQGTVFADINADGYTDYVRSKEGSNQSHWSFLNNKGTNQSSTGWTYDSNWNTPSSAYTDFADGSTFVDVNGDGLPDIFYRDATTTKVYMNNGSNWVLDAASPWNNTFGYGNLQDGSTQFADLNGDGLSDLIVHTGGPSSGSKTLINTGNGWYNDASWVLSEGSFTNLGTRMMDANADGMMDFMIHYNGTKKLYLNNGAVADLISKVDNGVGGLTTIVYVASTQFDNTFLPFPIQIVKFVEVSNQLGSTYRTDYFYEDGFWDADDREFRGFGYVKVIDPEDNYTKTTFLQDDIYKGRPAAQLSYDSTDTLFAKTENTWDKETIAPGVEFVYLKRKDNFIYDGDATGRRTAEEFVYGESPQYGNLTKAKQLGEVDLTTGSDIGTDSRRIDTFYHNVTSSGKWLLGFPFQVEVKDHNLNNVRETYFYYDGAIDFAFPPTVGLLTKKEDNISGAVNPETEYTYDVYGNLKTTDDPLNNTTTITYDTTYHVFPLTTQNALTHSITNEYYGVNGVPLSSGGYEGLWGQLKSTTDPNAQKGETVYDTFGRQSKTISPLDTLTYPTTETVYTFATTHAKIRSKSRIDHGLAPTIDVVQYADGLGRVIQTKSVSETSGTYVVSDQVEYNSRGMPEKSYLPYFTTNDLDTLDPMPTTVPHSTITYDAMGRVSQSTNPDNSYSSVVYDDWRTETINENGHKQVSFFDAYGRLIKKEEYSGADGRSTHYPISTYTLYATTLYEYDSEGSLTKVTDDQNNITTIVYDDLGRKTSMTDPDMGTWTYEYDLNGNLKKQTDAKSQVIDFTYDVLNRLKDKVHGTSLNVVYTYDDVAVNFSKGRLTKADYSPSNTTFKYDELGRETESTKVIDTINFKVKREYDALNRLDVLEYPDQHRILYEYNAAGQIELVKDESGSSGFIPPTLIYALPGDQTVDLKWNAITGATGYKVKYGTTSGTHPTVIDVGNVTTYTVSSLTNSITYYFVVTAYDASNETNKSNELSATPEASSGLPSPWVNSDIGNPTLSGSASHSAGTFTVKGAGTDIWGTSDQFHYVYQSLNGDGEIIAKVDSMTWTNPWAKAGVMIRESLAANSKHALMALTISNGTAFQRRTSTGGNSYHSGSSGPSAPYWVKLNRTGNVFKGYHSSDGQSWTQVGPSLTLSMNQNVYIGLALTSHNYGLLNTSLFSNVSVTAGSSAPSAPTLYVPVAGDKEVDLYWSSETGATGYKVKYGTTSGTYTTTIDVGNVTNYKVTGLTNSTAYYFAVTAYNASGESGVSNEKSATPQSSSGTPTEYVKNVDYNAAGQITKIEFGNGTETTYEYFTNNLRLKRILTKDSVPATIQDLNYTYDSAGNILTITDNANTATQTFTYDHLSRLLSANNTVYGNKTYTYDTIGNIKTKDGLTFTYGAGSAGPHAVTSLSDGTVFNYDANGNMIKKTKGTEVTDYIYDVENRLIEVKVDTVTIAEYEYDGDGGRTRKEVFSTGTCFLPGTQVEMADGSTKSIENIQLGDYVMAYDEESMSKIPQMVLNTFTNYNVEEFLIINDSLKVTPNHKVYVEGEWRKIGNLSLNDKFLSSELGEVSIEKIERVKLDKPIEAYDIEVEGNHSYFVAMSSTSSIDKTSETPHAFSGARQVSFILVHNQLTPPGGGGGPASSVVTRYVGSLYEETSTYSINFIFLGDTRVAAFEGTDYAIYHADHLGGTNLITTDTGVKRELVEYTPYGSIAKKELYGSNPSVADYYFTGKPLDDETGLYYYGARYYNPLIGRFLTADTLVPRVGDPQSFNRYSYAGNNPVNNIDPSGHSWFKKLWKSVVSAVAGVAAFVGSGFNPVVGFQAYSMVNSGLNLGQSLVTGQGIGQAFGTFAASFALSAGFGGAGWHDIVNPVMRVGAFAIEGATIGVAGSAINGGDLGKGAYTGAGTGAVMGFLSSEHYQNWREGDGFLSNERLAETYRQMAENGGDIVGELQVWKHKRHVGLRVLKKDGSEQLIGKYPHPDQDAPPGSMRDLKYILGKKTDGYIGNSMERKFPGQLVATYRLNQIQSVLLDNYVANGPKSFALTTNCTDWAVGAVRSVGHHIPKSSYSSFGFADPNKLHQSFRGQ